MKETFDSFKRITGYDLQSFFERFVNFINVHSANIVNYYNGGSLDNVSFNELDYLLRESSKISPLFENFGSNFTYLGYWELLDKFSDIHTGLLTFKNMGKWARSSRLNRYDSSVNVDRKIRQGETVERIVAESGYTDPQQDWFDLAVQNQLIEEEYTPDGGKIISISFQNNANIAIDNIVDSLSGKNVLGKDIKRRIEFLGNDLATVEYELAVEQALQVILGTVKGSIPEFPEDGTSSDSIGSNVNTLEYPSLFRNLLSMFQKDGRWSEITLLDLSKDQDNVFMKIECKTVLQDRVITNIPV